MPADTAAFRVRLKSAIRLWLISLVSFSVWIIGTAVVITYVLPTQWQTPASWACGTVGAIILLRINGRRKA